MGQARRQPEELIAASQHLLYEFWMLNSLGRGMASAVLGQGPLNNAVLESFAIHARVMLGFLYEGKRYPDDVVAGDYFDDPNDWVKVRPSIPEALIPVQKRANKEVAHLSYKRLGIADEARLWRFIDIAAAIGSIMAVFLRHVPAERLHPDWLPLPEPESP
ncbi:MAG: hypothetical protein WAV74_12730 [Anaerolineae bacterium]